MTSSETGVRTELRTYPDSISIAWTKKDLQHQARMSADSTMIRAAALNTPDFAFLSLERILAYADNLFTLYAQKCGATVVRHTWGLAAVEPPAAFEHPLIPAHHSLVAEVEILQNVRPVSAREAARIDASIRSVEDDPDLFVIWTESRPEQFVQGTSSRTQESGVWLVDIDPHLGTHASKRERL